MMTVMTQTGSRWMRCSSAYHKKLSGHFHNLFNRSVRNRCARNFSSESKAVKENESPEKKENVENSIHKEAPGPRPICFTFPGLGCQWIKMGEAMKKIIPFHESLKRSRETLKNVGVDLDQLLKPGNDSFMKNFHDAVVSITAIEIALVDTMTAQGVTPDLLIGHSLGEVLCAYADGSFTAEETLLVSHARGRSFSEYRKANPNDRPGAMAAINLSWSEVASDCHKNVYPACNNSAKNVTVSGMAEAVRIFVLSMKAQKVYTRKINCCGCAAHSPLVYSAFPNFVKYVEEFYPPHRQKPRSSKWISTSVPENEWDRTLARMNSANYFANNARSPVLYYEAFKHVPKNAIVVELAPMGVFHRMLEVSLDSQTLVVAPMTYKGDDGQKQGHFIDCMTAMNEAGIKMDLSVLQEPKSIFSL